MKRSDKLKPVIRYASAQEQRAASAYGASRQKLEQSQKKLSELQSWRQEYARQLQTQGQGGMNVGDIQNFRLFLGQLDRAIEHQQQLLKRARQEVEARLQEWHSRYRKTGVINKLQEKHLDTESLQQQKREQKEVDDRPRKPAAEPFL